MSTILTEFRWFSEIFAFFWFGKSSLSIGRVNLIFRDIFLGIEYKVLADSFLVSLLHTKA